MSHSKENPARFSQSFRKGRIFIAKPNDFDIPRIFYFESGNILNRTKSLLLILIPLFISAFRIAQDMAMAMEARCYRGGEGRTRMHKMEYEKRDYIAAVIVVLFFAIIIFERIYI